MPSLVAKFSFAAHGFFTFQALSVMPRLRAFFDH